MATHDDNTSAERAKLEAFGTATASLSLGELVSRFEAYGLEVETAEDGYRLVDPDLTLHGLRARLAMLDYLEPLRAPSSVVASRQDGPFDPIRSLQNPLKAFLTATKPLDGCCYCGDEAFHRGGRLIAIMAAQLRDQDDNPKLPLTISDCADVLAFLISTQATVPGDVALSGGGATDAQIKKYGGDPGFGLYLIFRHLSEQLRRQAEGAAP